MTIEAKHRSFPDLSAYLIGDHGLEDACNEAVALVADRGTVL
jgi:hypothetical protein